MAVRKICGKRVRSASFAFLLLASINSCRLSVPGILCSSLQEYLLLFLKPSIPLLYYAYLPRAGILDGVECSLVR
jgi:hypothetical protein